MKECKREGCSEAIDEKSSRKDKVFCSDRCRIAAYREEAEKELLAAVKKAVNARVKLP
jgi:predicted nucleic acid-binding Zn ribbon protein